MLAVHVPSTLRRIFAHFIDGIIKSCFFAPAFSEGIYQFWRTGNFTCHLYLLVAAWVLDFLFKIICLYYLAATPGKLLFGLRVVPRNAPARTLFLTQTVIRVLTDQLALFLGWGVWSLALLRHDRTHLSDWLAETRVVQSAHRQWPPVRRWFLGSILVIYCSISGWSSAQKIFRHVEISDGQVRINSLFPD